MAVKRYKIRPATKAQMLNFCSEVEIICRAVHRNIIEIIGFCVEGGERILVFPYMENGSVEQNLRWQSSGRVPLNIASRHKIATGTARGLLYLHTESSVEIIHRDVKSANILVSSRGEALLSDFGLATLLLVEGEVTRGNNDIRGTLSHVAPESLLSVHVTPKADVYSFGVFLLELISGLPPPSLLLPPSQEGGVEGEGTSEHCALQPWLKRRLKEGGLSSILDPIIWETDSQKILENPISAFEPMEILSQICLLCLEENPRIRLSIQDCLSFLQKERFFEAKNLISRDFSRENNHFPSVFSVSGNSVEWGEREGERREGVDSEVTRIEMSFTPR